MSDEPTPEQIWPTRFEDIVGTSSAGRALQLVVREVAILRAKVAALEARLPPPPENT